MAMTVRYNGDDLAIETDAANRLLEAFESGESGVVGLDRAVGHGTLFVAYGPGIPVTFDTTDD